MYQALVFENLLPHDIPVPFVTYDFSAVSLLPQHSYLFWVSLPHEVPTILSVIRPFA